MKIIRYWCALELDQRPRIAVDVVKQERHNPELLVSFKGHTFILIINPDMTVDLMAENPSTGAQDRRRIRVGVGASITYKRN